jgi:hypothetical protein
VTLFEADDRLGGHAHTHEPADGDDTVAVRPANEPKPHMSRYKRYGDMRNSPG